MKALFNRAGEGAGARAEFDDNFRLFQFYSFQHSRGKPAGTRHDRTRQSGRAQENTEKFCILTQHKRNVSGKSRRGQAHSRREDNQSQR
jgi:hypothetical protein